GRPPPRTLSSPLDMVVTAALGSGQLTPSTGLQLQVKIPGFVGWALAHQKVAMFHPVGQGPMEWTPPTDPASRCQTGSVDQPVTQQEESVMNITRVALDLAKQ